MPFSWDMAQADAGSGAVFALAGVCITGVVTIIALFIKSVLDTKAETRRHARQVELDTLRYSRDVEKLRLELGEKRMDTLRTQQVQLIGRYLAACLVVYRETLDAYRERLRTGEEDAYRRARDAINPGEAQVALEELRLICSDAVADDATRLWQHIRDDGLRRNPPPMLNSTFIYRWKSGYWGHRQALVLQFQGELRGGGTSPGPE